MDNQAFQTFCQENFGPIYRFVYKKVRNREEAEDLTSQIFLKAVSGIDRERSRQSMQQWLYLIARTLIADHWRAHYRLPMRSEEHTSELQSHLNLVCRLLLEKKKKIQQTCVPKFDSHQYADTQ